VTREQRKIVSFSPGSRATYVEPTSPRLDAPEWKAFHRTSVTFNAHLITRFNWLGTHSYDHGFIVRKFEGAVIDCVNDELVEIRRDLSLLSSTQ
jgi:hypothetical protein